MGVSCGVFVAIAVKNANVHFKILLIRDPVGACNVRTDIGMAIRLPVIHPHYIIVGITPSSDVLILIIRNSNGTALGVS
jgi:hypothetical protein